MLLDNLANKSDAGDKIEIYALLKQHAPEVLQEITKLPEDSRIRKLLRYAEGLTK